MVRAAPLTLLAGCAQCGQPAECGWEGDEAVDVELLSDSFGRVEQDGEAPDLFVIRDEEELRRAWPGDDPPDIDFTRRQVVVLNAEIGGCPRRWRQRGVREVAGDPDHLLLFSYRLECPGGCDTGDVNRHAIWSTPIAEVSLCEEIGDCGDTW